jgi:hypothetical protein
MDFHQDIPGFPTVLVAVDEAISDPLVTSLRDAGYHVLQATSWEEASHFVRTHSRPIHVLLIDPKRAESAKELRLYRPAELTIVSVTPSILTHGEGDQPFIETVLATVNGLVAPPRKTTHSKLKNTLHACA